MKMTKEYVWFNMGIVGLLSQIGGTFWKAARRVLCPLVLTASTILYEGFSFWWVLMGIAYFGVATLPVTLIGDSVPGHWANWIWVFLLGGITASPQIILGWRKKLLKMSLLNLIIPAVVYGVVILLSNIPATAFYFQWKAAEFLMWVSIAYTHNLLITKEVNK